MSQDIFDDEDDDQDLRAENPDLKSVDIDVYNFIASSNILFDLMNKIPCKYISHKSNLEDSKVVHL